MEDTTTTDAPATTGDNVQGVSIDDSGSAISQPEEAETSTADTSEAVTPEEQTTSSEPSEDDQLASWAEKKGLQLDSDNAKKAAKMAREAERAMHQKAQRASELEKSMTEMSDDSAQQIADATGQDPEVLKRIQRMEVKDAIREFWDANPDAKQYESEMTSIAVDAGLFGSPEAILKASYAMAKAGNLDAVKSEGKREALETLAQKQQASVPTGNAVNGQSMASSQITPGNVDKLVAQNNMDWFMKNREAINKAMEG